MGRGLNFALSIERRSLNPAVTQVTTCDGLKSSIEIGGGSSGTFKFLNDITCTESIKIVSGQTVSVLSDIASSGGTSIITGRRFVGLGNSTTNRSNATVTADREGDAPGGHSVFVVEQGGSLSLSHVKFTHSSFGEDGDSVGNSEEERDGEEGVRAIYSAGDLSARYCDFVGLGGGSAGRSGSDDDDNEVVNGGAVRRRGRVRFVMCLFCLVVWLLVLQEYGCCTCT